MLTPDLQDCTYTAEVLRTRAATLDVANRIAGFALGPQERETVSDAEGVATTIIHAFVASTRVHHRANRMKRGPEGQIVELPRRQKVRGNDRFLYDILMAHRLRHTIVAVPFYSLGEEVFPHIDRELAGTRTTYEQLDITNIVIGLGLDGRTTVSDEAKGQCEIGVTQCKLTYSDEESRSRNLQSVRLIGANLGATEEYRFLIRPVLAKGRPAVSVTPVVLGFSLYVEGVRKASAVTDRHGNFKVFVGPGLRQVRRLFDLLDMVEQMENVASTTTNVPIFQGRSIRDDGGA